VVIEKTVWKEFLGFLRKEKGITVNTKDEYATGD